MLDRMLRVLQELQNARKKSAPSPRLDNPANGDRPPVDGRLRDLCRRAARLARALEVVSCDGDPEAGLRRLDDTQRVRCVRADGRVVIAAAATDKELDVLF